MGTSLHLDETARLLRLSGALWTVNGVTASLWTVPAFPSGAPRSPPPGQSSVKPDPWLRGSGTSPGHWAMPNPPFSAAASGR